MKNIAKKPIAKKVKVEKSALKKIVSKKDDKKIEEVIIPVASPISSSDESIVEKVEGEITPVTLETREKRKEREVEEFLRATEESLPVTEIEKSNHSYILIVAVVLFLVTIFGIYKIFFSSQKTGSIVTPVTDKEVVVTVVQTPVPVEKITITDPVVTTESKKEIIATIANPKTLKESSVFKSFTYDAKLGKQISLSSTCHDKYYAFLIFDSLIDYRKDPGMAQGNKAFECPSSGHFTVDMNLKDINLQNGTYYLFVADQGPTGSWYNPR